MNTLRYYFFVIMFLVGMPLLLLAPTPDTVQFSVVFDYAKDPVQGVHDVVVRLYNSNEMVYKETVSSVSFDHGVGVVVIGGEGSNLFNKYFDDPSVDDPFIMEVQFSVKQHQIRFPVSTVPYTIRSKESNKARRLDGEHIMKFEESKQRVGINNLEPEVTLDVNGGLRIGKQSSHQSLGTLHWDPLEPGDSGGQFYVYIKNHEGLGTIRENLSFSESSKHFSKWTWDSPQQNHLISNRSVGIGFEGMEGVSLIVSPNMGVVGDVFFGGAVFVERSAILNSGFGFNTNGDLTIKKVRLNDQNKWNANGNGDLYFSGKLFGRAHPTGLVNLHHFRNNVFEARHFSTDSPLIASHNLKLSLASLSEDYIKNYSITMADLNGLSDITENAIADSSISSLHIKNGSIQNHHVTRNIISFPNNIVFNSRIISTNAIHGEHIKDGTLTADYLEDKSVLSEHVVTNSILAHYIESGSLTSDHVSDKSIPYTAISLFSKDQGGTGIPSLLDKGLIFINSLGEYTSNPNVLMFKNNRLIIGGQGQDPDAKVHLVGDVPQVKLSSAADYSSSLRLLSTQSTWNMGINADGDFIISEDDSAHLVITGAGNICGVGCVGIGVSNPAEQLVVSGGINLWERPSGVGTALPGTIEFTGHQKLKLHYKTSHKEFGMSSVNYRMYASVYAEDIDKSSIIYTDTSDIFGSHLFVNGVIDSVVHGQALYSDHVLGSQLYGVDSKGTFLNQSYAVLTQSEALFVTDSDVSASQSKVHLVSDSELDLQVSSVGFLQDVSLNAMGSYVQHSYKVQGNLDRSNGLFLRQVDVDVQDSVVQHVDRSFVAGRRSFFGAIDNATVYANGSRIEHVSNALVDVDSAWVQQVSDATIVGTDIVVMGGEGHRISGARHVSLNGDHHHLSGLGSVAIGDNLQSQYDRTVLLNASEHPLRADRDGQIKLQADGNVVLQFSPDMAISMVDSMGGWAHVSDKNIKTVLAGVSRTAILDKMRKLPIQYWAYKNQFEDRHLGPTAQDFSRLFHYGNSDKVIHTIDSDGVLLASVQALHQQFNNILTDLDTHSDQYTSDVSRLQTYHVALDAMTDRLSGLELMSRQYMRVMDQLAEDYDAQRHLLSYLVRQMQFYELGIMLESIFHPSLLLGLLCFSVVFGGLICVIYSRRVRR